MPATDNRLDPGDRSKASCLKAPVHEGSLVQILGSCFSVWFATCLPICLLLVDCQSLESVKGCLLDPAATVWSSADVVVTRSPS